MADKNTLEQMLEHLVNDEQQKAEELFHEYVVSKSREIYETLIEEEMKDDEEEDEEVEEAADTEDDEDEKVDEEFEDIAIEADDEMGGDPTDDLEGDLEADEEGEEGEEGEESEEDMMQDIGEIIDELQAKFDALQNAEEEQGEFDMGDDSEEEMKDDFGIENDLDTVREYVEKVPAGHGAEKKGAAEKADNIKSTIDNMKNDMGGTTANILSGRNGAEGSTGGALKGNGLVKGAPKEDNAGNINVPGGKAGNAFSKKEPGHGAEKKGSAESADNKQSLFRGRR